jgi:mRNA interferase YafQ
MRHLVLTPKFKRAFQKFCKRDSARQRRIEDALRLMEQDVFMTGLGTHKLSGSLSGYWACSCGYDCRIIFSLETDLETGEEVVVLLDVGTHDEVY